MKEQMKAMARPYGTLFLIALAVALVGRVGLAAMDLTGTLPTTTSRRPACPSWTWCAPS